MGATLAGLLLAALASVVLWRRYRDRAADSPAHSPTANAHESEHPPLETDEERVIAHLRDCGGQAPQQRLIELTGWSPAKVSRVLTELAEDDVIVKIPVGRENVIQLNCDSAPPTAAGLADADADADA